MYYQSVNGMSDSKTEVSLTSTTIKGLQANTQYIIIVRAVDEAVTEGTGFMDARTRYIKSDWSTTQNVTTGDFVIIQLTIKWSFRWGFILQNKNCYKIACRYFNNFITHFMHSGNSVTVKVVWQEKKGKKKKIKKNKCIFLNISTKFEGDKCKILGTFIRSKQIKLKNC